MLEHGFGENFTRLRLQKRALSHLEHASSIFDYLQPILVIFSVVKNHFSSFFMHYPRGQCFDIRRRLVVCESVGEVRLIRDSNRC